MIKRLILPGAILLAGYYALFGGEYTALDVREVNRSAEALEAELETLELRTDSLRARADSLESDDMALETIARERFGLIREGEVLYRFTQP